MVMTSLFMEVMAMPILTYKMIMTKFVLIKVSDGLEIKRKNALHSVKTFDGFCVNKSVKMYRKTFCCTMFFLVVCNYHVQ